MEDHFDQLIRELANFQVAVDAAYLHGLLTGYATIPTMDSLSLFPAIAGEQPLAESVFEAVYDSINSIAKSLSAHEFQARFDIHRDTDANRWLDGYFRAVEIHEERWQELNETHLNAGTKLMMLHTMRDAKLHRDLTMDLPGPKDLKRNPQLVTDMVGAIYHQFDADADNGFPPAVDALSLSRDIADADLAAMDEATLMAFVISSDDALPFEVVTECASRQDAMVPLLQQHLDTDTYWNANAHISDWWALLHAIFILGLIPGEASASSLLNAFRRINFAEYSNLADWFSSRWPALTRNKREFTTAPLRQIAEDRGLRWYPRCQAIDCVMADAVEQSAAALETAIDWLAALCSDAVEDTEFRVIAGHSLLDFPRQRHRSVMEALVDLQTHGSIVEHAYRRDDIERSFDEGDSPEWRNFDNAWQFYDPEEILRRQQRWFQESEEFDFGSRGSTTHGSAKPYTRQAPRVGRNEPCVCGSGKKYKKCCLRLQR